MVFKKYCIFILDGDITFQSQNQFLIQGAFQNKRDFCHKIFLVAPSVNEVVRWNVICLPGSQ